MAALLAAHPGAAAEKDNKVRPPRSHPSAYGPRAYADSLARLRAAQFGILPLHFAAANQVPEAVVAVLLAAHPGAAKKKDKVRPPLLHTVFCDDV